MKMSGDEFGEHDIHMRLVIDVDIPLLNWLREQARMACDHAVTAECVAAAILRDVMKAESGAA